uniref:Reverse transcriptase domain-containing protein n=1 Tax=Haemonchus contortus TaxID=6289 RepID=A0A7I4Z3I2_HAECO
MDEAAEAGKSIRKARRSFANYKTKMTSLRRPDGTVTASRRAMEKVIYDFCSDWQRILDEGQPCEQAGFRRWFSTIDHIHTLTRLIEVSREYKMPLCLTFIALKEAFDTVETEAVIEALGNQGVPTQFIRMLRELYDNFTTRISPFYKEVIINVKRGVRQGDTISPKLPSAALENIMRHLE